MWDGLEIIRPLSMPESRLRLSTAAISTSPPPMGRGFMAMMSAMAEDERLRIIKRTHEGRQIARAKGVKMGRKPILTPYQTKESAAAHRPKGETTREGAKAFNVSISAISRLADVR